MIKKQKLIASYKSAEQGIMHQKLLNEWDNCDCDILEHEHHIFHKTL